MKSKKITALIISLALISPLVVNQKVDAINITEVINSSVENYKEIPTKYNVPETKNFEIKFNKEISFTSINSNTIKVVDSKGNEVPVKLTPKAAYKRIVVVNAPVGGYKEGETYALIIKKGISSLNSFKLVDETVMKFVVASKPVSNIEPMVITSYTIDNNTRTEEVPIHSAISINLNGHPYPDCINRNTVVIKDSNGNLVNSTIVEAGTEVQIAPPKEGYKYNTQYTITLTTDIYDGWASKRILEEQKLTFKTKVVAIPFTLMLPPYDAISAEFKSNLSDWSKINTSIPKVLYEYPYILLDSKYALDSDAFTRNKDLVKYLDKNYLNKLDNSNLSKWKYWDCNEQLTTIKGYMQAKYNYDYRNNTACFDNFKKYVYSGAIVETATDTFFENYYRDYFNKLKANKIVSKAEFITDNSLAFYQGGGTFTRGRLKIMYTSASESFLKEYGIKLNKWYYIDKQVSARDGVAVQFESWKTVKFPVNKEYNLSGLLTD